MAQLDHSATATVGQFAQSMGLGARQNDDGSFGFDFSESGRLSIVAAAEGDDVLVSLTRRIILDDAVPLARFAAASGYDALSDSLLQGGLNGADQPVLTLALRKREFDLPRLEGAFDTLRRAFTDCGL